MFFTCPLVGISIHYFWYIYGYTHRRIAVTDLLALVGNARHFPEVIIPVYTSSVRASLVVRVNTWYHYLF